jgi:hypothetical protein
MAGSNSDEKTGLERLISSMGTGFELLKTLARAVETAGGTEEDLRKILNHQNYGHLTHYFGQMLVEKIPLAVLDVRELDFWVDPGDGDIERLIREAPFGRRKIKVPFDVVKFKESFAGPSRVKIGEFPIEGGPAATWSFSGQVREQARKQKKKIASVQHLLAFVAKYPDVARQVSLRFPHAGVYVSVYGSDRTLRWERAADWWYSPGITHCLVMAD